MRRSSRLAAANATQSLKEINSLPPVTKTKTSTRDHAEEEHRQPKRSKNDARREGNGSMLAREEHYWEKGCKFVLGVDEAGRGPLAGPVVVAACAISPEWEHEEAHLINDSKKLNETARDALFKVLTEDNPHVFYEIAIVSPKQIDEMNILRASLFGMDQVVSAMCLRGQCDAVLIDGPYAPPTAKKEQKHIEAIKSGDAKVRAIAAASIIAKVTRDRIMLAYHAQFPAYGFDKHKGYPVKAHVQALNEFGPCEIHRRSYAPVRNAAAAVKGADK